MRLLKFLEKESGDSYQQVLIIATISGMANSMLLGIVNHATEAVANDEDLTQYFIIYMITFALFLYAQWYAFERSIIIIEEAIFNIRTNLANKVKQVELSFMERMGSNKLYSRLTQNDTLIAQSVPPLVSGFQMFALMIFSLIYLGYISPISFIITLISLGLGIMYFLSLSRFIKESLRGVRKKEEVYFKSISHLVNGFKEVKMNHKKGEDLSGRISTVANEAHDIKRAVGKHESRLWGFGRLFIYALLPVLIFVIPSFVDEHANDIFKISATLLFLIGPTTFIVNMIPLLNRVNMAIEDLFLLEAEMDEAIIKTQSRPLDSSSFLNFNNIKIDNLVFNYPNDDDSAFSSGPFDENIKRGELLFIIGGNGSGKSTFLKLLTGLYYPVAGRITVDSTIIKESSYPAYREIFSVIFTDFYLFDKFYGIPDLDEKKVNYWLDKMWMSHKVQLQDGGFTSTSLSTGQRKRLAFIAAMLEEKPVLIIDEFAADQDPQFREYFYETLLPELKASGKTVIAVTHDDHYFHVADRVLKMDEGRFVDYQQLPQSS